MAVIYADVAYLGKRHEDIFIEDKPLVITASGRYIVKDDYRISTNRRLGRNDYQLLYIADGQVEFYFGNEVRYYGKGNMILFTPGTPQRYYLYAKYRPETYWVHFTGHGAHGLIRQYGIPENEPTFIGMHDGFGRLVKRMTVELREKQTGYERTLELMLEQLLIRVARYLAVPNTHTHTDIEQATNFFDEHFHEDIVIERVAASMFVKPCWFIRKFKAAVGQTPMQYILGLRIAKAKELLEKGGQNVSQVASAVGYDNPLYFSRIFKKYVGVSPTEYKRK